MSAQVGMAAFAQATVAWLDDPALGLGDRLDRAYGELKTMFSASTSPHGGKPRAR